MWKGIVTGSTSIGSMTRLAGASDSGNAIGDYVELLPASAWGNNMATGLLVEHNQDGTHGAVTATSVSTDTISEKTSAAGVTIDGMQIKDSSIVGASGKGVKNASLDTAAGELGGTWATWTPTMTNVSGGTITSARYMKIGKTIHFSLKYTLAGANVSGVITFSPPVDIETNSVGQVINARGLCYDSSASSFIHAMCYASSASAFLVIVGNASVNYLGTSNTSSTVPFTWASSDTFSMSGTYEAA